MEELTIEIKQCLHKKNEINGRDTKMCAKLTARRFGVGVIGLPVAVVEPNNAAFCSSVSELSVCTALSDTSSVRPREMSCVTSLCCCRKNT